MPRIFRYVSDVERVSFDLCYVLFANIFGIPHIQGWDSESEKRAAWYRKQLIRWLNLAHVLVYRQANNQDDLEGGIFLWGGVKSQLKLLINT